jgi:acetoin utilization protein AcuB
MEIALAERRQPTDAHREEKRMQVEDYMHTVVITVTPEDRVSTAGQRLRGHRIRHLPVVTGGNTLVGVITDRDIRQAGASDAPRMAAHELTYLLEKMTVQELMTRQVVTVSRQTPMAEAAQIFLTQRFGCLPVVRADHTLEGIITVTDLLRAYVDRPEFLWGNSAPTSAPPAPPEAKRGRLVGAMMQTVVVTGTPDMSLAEAQRLMRAERIRHLPVVSGTRLVGIVTDRDLRDATPSPATTLSRGEIAYQLNTTPLKTCMTTDVVWINPDMDMVPAARILLDRAFGCLPVVEDGALVGVVTEIDCLRAFLSLQ